MLGLACVGRVGVQPVGQPDLSHMVWGEGHLQKREEAGMGQNRNTITVQPSGLRNAAWVRKVV